MTVSSASTSTQPYFGIVVLPLTSSGTVQLSGIYSEGLGDIPGDMIVIQFNEYFSSEYGPLNKLYLGVRSYAGADPRSFVTWNWPVSPYNRPDTLTVADAWMERNGVRLTDIDVTIANNFELTASIADDIPPQVTAIHFDDIITGQNDRANFQVDVEGRDPQTGVFQVSVVFATPIQQEFRVTDGPTIWGVFDNYADGRSSTRFDLRFAEPGVYDVKSVVATDYGGNETEFDPTDIDMPERLIITSDDNVATRGNDVLVATDAVSNRDGQAGDDYIIGNAAANVLLGGDGNDTIDGGAIPDLSDRARIDTLDGGRGNDQLISVEGNDILIGGAGDDLLLGSQGDNRLVGGAGDDTLVGGAGYDVFVVRNDGSSDVIEDFRFVILSDGDHSSGNVIELSDWGLMSFADVQALMSDDGFGNTIISNGHTEITVNGVEPQEFSADDFRFWNSSVQIVGTQLGQTLRGFSDNDSITALNGNDTIEASFGNDTIFGGDGHDVISFREAFTQESISSLEAMHLASADPSVGIVVNLSNGRVDGWAGNTSWIYGIEEVDGTEFNDALFGADAFAVTLNAGDGDDQLWGYFNEGDVLTATGGTNLLVAFGGSSTIRGGSDTDYILTSYGNNVVEAGDGNDMVYARFGTNYVDLGGGYNLFIGYNNSSDTVIGGDLDDYIYAGDGNDSLVGNAGNDWLSGGAGADTLEGGTGYDRFIFADETGHDLIADFTDGEDFLDFTTSALVESFGDLTVIQSGADLDVSWNSALSGVTLRNMSITNFTAADVFI